MWIFLWLVLSAILIGATIWSLQILMRQKNAWQTYAKKKNFTFNRGTFMGPAEMSGVIGDYKVSFFTAVREGQDVRTRRYVTVVEIDLAEGLVDGAAVGTKEMLPFLQSLSKLHPYTLEQAGLEEGNFVFARNDAVVKSYLTKERVDVIADIMKTRNCDTLLIFNDEQMVLRLETSDPMQNADKIDKIVTRLLSLTDKLRISKEERERYGAAA